jgi:hypothetical protein
MVFTLISLSNIIPDQIFISLNEKFMFTTEIEKQGESRQSMNTLTERVNKAVMDGYVENFKVTNMGLFAPSLNKCYRPEEIQVVNFYRFEGESDPADNTIMYIIETTDGIKGTLIDAYGPYADAVVNKFMKEVEEISKK